MHRLIFVFLALVSLIWAWVCLTAISRNDPWYRNANMNIHNMVDALAINSDVSPNKIDQPGMPLKYLLALDYRVRHYLGLLPVWNLKKFGASQDPLREIPPLIHVERIHSRVMVLLVILAGAWLTYSVSRSLDAACLSVVLLCGSSGLLFHGLLTRPELLCVGFGCVLALACTWRSTASTSRLGHDLWLFLAGLLVGLAALTKVPGACYLVPCYAWCWLSAGLPGVRGPESNPADDHTNFRRGLLAAVGGASALLLLVTISHYHDQLDPLVALRLRIAAVGVGILPLLPRWTGHNRFWSFFVDRGRELALLGAGALAALSLGYWSLRAVMTEPGASNYFAGVLHVVVNPDPVVSALMAPQPSIAREFMTFFKETPFLFVSTIAATVAACLMGSLPRRLKAFMVLLLLTALGMTILASKLSFAAPFSIFAQVPLLLVWSLILFGLFGARREQEPRASGNDWAFPVAMSAMLVLLLTVYFRLEPKYTSYQSDAGLPVNDLTLTFIFDHDAHPQAYLRIMTSHYGDRAHFASTLGQYLADPAHRY